MSSNPSKVAIRATLAAALLGLFGVLAAVAPASADGHTRIHLIHGIPGVEVDVIVDGDAVFESFAFKDTQDLSTLAGATLVGLKVNAAGTDTTVIDAGDVTLPSEGNYTVFAHLDADGDPALAVFENDVSAVAAGQGRLVVRHAAAAPAVDVKANGAVAFSDLGNGGEAKADLDAGTISAEVVPTGADDPVVIGPADLAVTEGAALIVYATGSLDDGLEVVVETIDGLGPVPGAVHTGDSPVEDRSSMAAPLAGLAALTLVVGRLFARRASRVRPLHPIR